jgi:hypothetical protein
MDLSATTQPWTAAVPWARAWHRPAPVARAVPPASVARARGPGAAVATLAEAEWEAARSALAQARAWLDSLDPADSGDWPGLMATHAVRLAAARARAAQAALAGPDTYWRA